MHAPRAHFRSNNAFEHSSINHAYSCIWLTYCTHSSFRPRDDKHYAVDESRSVWDIFFADIVGNQLKALKHVQFQGGRKIE